MNPSSNLPATAKFTPEHEWLTLDGEIATVGITHHAQDALGDVVFVELPEIGRTYAQHEVAGVVESTKAASDIFMPIGGEVVEVNEALRADPTLANREPEAAGWFFRIRPTNPAEVEGLLDMDAYRASLG